MKPSREQIVRAVGQLGCLRYFPSETEARAAVMGLLAEMVSTPEQLGWLVRTMVNEIGEWQGPKELRGVFCSRFRPADGIEAECSIGKFSPTALEGSIPQLPARPMLQIAGTQEIRPEVLEAAETKLLETFERIRSRGVPKRRDSTADEVNQRLKAVLG